MKTEISLRTNPLAGFVRGGLRTAAAATAMVLCAGNLLAYPVVSFLSGGPNQGYPSGAGYVDGDITSEAVYNTPSGLAMDLSGNYLFVADRNNNVVRVLDFSINTTATLLTYTNEVQATGLFSQPVGVAIDPNDNIFVLNRGNGKNGNVLEFDYTSELLATNLTKLTNAEGIAIDPNDDVFVTAGNQVFEASAVGVISIVATITAPNCSLGGIVVKHNGLLAVCDTGRNGILLINPGSGLVTTNAGFHGQGDFITVNDFAYSNQAAFFQPSGITESGDGTLVVTDFGNNRVKAVLANGVVTNIYGVSSNDWAGDQWPGYQDGTASLPDQPGGPAARSPFGVVIAPNGTLFVSEDYYHVLRQVTGTGFIPEPIPPQPPTTLSAVVVTNAGNVAIYLQWSGGTGATNYLVERSTSPNGFSIIGQTSGQSFLDQNVQAGYTYYYVIQSEGSGGISPASPIAAATIPIPPPSAPVVGWYDFEGSAFSGFYSTIHAVSPGNPFVIHNPVSLAIETTNGWSTYYVTSPPYPTNTSAATIAANGSTAPTYHDGVLFGDTQGNVNPLPYLPLSNGMVTVEAVNTDAGGASAVTSATFYYLIGNPTISSPNGGQLNAAQFTVTDVSTNVIFYYTLDGTDPTNAPVSQQVYTTNGTVTLSLNGSTNILFKVRAIGYGTEASYQMSGISQYAFTPGTFVPNQISWGFANGECSSAFIGAAGQTFLAPVTLTMLPNVSMYSMQFNMTVSSTGAGITYPAPPAGPFNFVSMLLKPAGNGYYAPIPPYAFAGIWGGEDPDIVNYEGTNFVNLVVSNGNELAVGWVERFGQTNLYNTKSQTLITYSQAHDDLFPNAAQGEPNGVIVGAYTFQLSPSAVNGQQYQIQLSGASGTSDGVGAPGSGINIYSAGLTNPAALAPGTLNGIKNVIVGSIPYLVGNVYPFRWFNAGDFGNSNLQSADVQQVFNSAIYFLNTPPPTCDMYDAMDSCGHLGYVDQNPTDPNYGFYTNAGPLTLTQQQQLFQGNYSLVNNMAFGDGTLDISDIYLTFLRSEFTNNFMWFQRLWTNGVRVASATWAPGIIPPSQGGGRVIGGGQITSSAPVSITNTPIANFTTTDFAASAGQTLSIPINSTVFGPYPMRMLLLNISVVPLDGSPALTSPVQFTPSSSLNAAFGSSTPWTTGSSGNGNFSATWLPNTMNVTQLPGFTNTTTIGVLTVTIPTNAGSMSAYAIHFDKASGSPSGLLSFPSRTWTGLITLSSRTNSTYNDGIPDSWRLRYFGTVNNELSVSNADADGTGMNNWQKYLAGLNPMDSTSVLNEGTDQAMAQNPHDFVLYWPSVNGKTYIIERSLTLFPAHWTAVSTNIGDGTYMEIHDSSGGANCYYEVTTP